MSAETVIEVHGLTKSFGRFQALRGVDLAVGRGTVHGFLGQIFSLDNLEFLVAYACVGGFFALLVFAISVVSVPMMLDRGTDGVVAVLTSARAFAANLPAMIVWAVTIVVVVAAGFALLFVGLVVAVPLIGHATWHAYRALVEPPAG